MAFSVHAEHTDSMQSKFVHVAMVEKLFSDTSHSSHFVRVWPVANNSCPCTALWSVYKVEVENRYVFCETTQISARLPIHIPESFDFARLHIKNRLKLSIYQHILNFIR